MRIRQLIPLAFLVGCSGKDPGEEGGDPFATKTTEDLRWKTFYQENMDEDGVYAVRQFSYTYGGDAHRYYTEAVGSVTADAEEKAWVHTHDLDPDGFPLRRRTEVEGEFHEEVHTRYDPALHRLTQWTLYDGDPDAGGLPARERSYEWNAQGRLLAKEETVYFDGTSDVLTFQRHHFFMPRHGLPGTEGLSVAASSLVYEEDGELNYQYTCSFDEDGYPVGDEVDIDADGELEGTNSYGFEWNDRGWPTMMSYTSDSEPDSPQWTQRYEYGDDHLLDRAISHEPDEDSGELVETVALEITWHPNPVGGPSGGKIATKLVDTEGLPTTGWTEMFWSEGLFTQDTYDVEGRQTMTVSAAQEEVDVPVMTVDDW